MIEKAVIFNGDLDGSKHAVSRIISNYIAAQLGALNISHTQYNIADSSIPLLDLSLEKLPESVLEMTDLMTAADIHFWLSPLYHGAIPGVMKNALDWMEITATNPTPYLTDAKIGMICWANGSQAMQGINNMDAIAKALRAWPLPYSIPIVRRDLLEKNNSRLITKMYRDKINLLIKIATTKRIRVIE